MKKKFTLSRLFHHDKLMMVLSLVVAIIIWAVVVYGPSNIQVREITGVPVSITLPDSAVEKHLRIVDGADATVTVRVRGPRSVVGQLSAQDINVTANTGKVIEEGFFELSVKADVPEDCEIVSVIGSDGVNATVSITCDVWREQNFPVEVELPNLTVTDVNKYRFDTAVVNGEAIVDGQVTVVGPKTDISRIHRVVAVIPDAATLQTTTVFTAELRALDESGNRLTTVSFPQVEGGKVNVVVPVLEYRKVTLTAAVQNVPAGYKNTAGLVTVTPTELEIWGVPSELDEYIQKVQQQISVNFDTVTPDNLVKEFVLGEVEGVRPVNGSETVQLKVNLDNLSTRTFDISLTADNFSVTNCPAGYTVKLTQQKLSSVTLCGDAATLSHIKPEDIYVVADMKGKSIVGQQEAAVRVYVRGVDTVWAVYEGTLSVMVAVTQG